MGPQEFITINVVIAVALGLFFMRGRKQKRPSKLRFGSGPKDSTKAPALRAEAKVQEASRDEAQRAKNLNVIFIYNGHTWDAYEVLGLPAGSSRAAVDAAFQKMLKTSKPESEGFLRAAFEAIKRS